MARAMALLATCCAGSAVAAWPPPVAQAAAEAWAAVSPRLSAISVCDHRRRERATLCVRLHFEPPANQPSAEVTCNTFPHNASRTDVPEWYEFLNLERVTCLSAARCEYFVPAGINFELGGLYDVFCTQWNVEPQIVVPACDGHGPCGMFANTSSTTWTAPTSSMGVIDLLGAVLVMVYVLWSYVFERVRILHETGASVLVGLAGGLVLKVAYGRTVTFSYDMFCYVLLPLVIFSAGFNLQKRDFFRYSGYILALGVTGTVTTFLLIFYGSVAMDAFGVKRSSLSGVEIDLSPHYRLILASVLASSDTVAPMAFLPAASFPRLYAVVFGEGILNDVVSILLSTSVADAEHMPSIGTLFVSILFFLVTSVSVGLVFGLGTSLLFKWGKMLHTGMVKPCALLFCLNYTCYVVAELLEISSIFSMFVCAVLCGHYAQYWLQDECQVVMRELAEIMSYCAEATVFGYFGLTAVEYMSQDDSSSPSLVCFYSLAIVTARVLTIVLTALSLRALRCGQALSLTARDFSVIGLAGCMRGTIAFALILKAMPAEEAQNRSEKVLVSTVLGIVLVNCLLFGGIFPLALKLLGVRAQVAQGRGIRVTGSERSDLGNGPSSRVRRGLHRCWHNVDTRWMKPMFRPPPPLAGNPAGVFRDSTGTWHTVRSTSGLGADLVPEPGEAG